MHIGIGEGDCLDSREHLQDLGLGDSCDSLHDSLVTAYLGEVLGVLDTGREHSCICRASKHLEDRVSHTGEGLSQGSILSICKMREKNSRFEQKINRISELLSTYLRFELKTPFFPEHDQFILLLNILPWPHRIVVLREEC